MFDINESWGDDIVNQAQHQDGIDENMFDISESWGDDIVKQAHNKLLLLLRTVPRQTQEQERR